MASQEHFEKLSFFTTNCEQIAKLEPGDHKPTCVPTTPMRPHPTNEAVWDKLVLCSSLHALRTCCVDEDLPFELVTVSPIIFCQNGPGHIITSVSVYKLLILLSLAKTEIRNTSL